MKVSISALDGYAGSRSRVGAPDDGCCYWYSRIKTIPGGAILDWGSANCRLLEESVLLQALPAEQSLHQSRIDRVENHESPVERAAGFIGSVTHGVVHEFDGDFEQRIQRQVTRVCGL